MFKKIAVYSFFAFGLIACAKTAPPPQNAGALKEANDSPFVSGHSQSSGLSDGNAAPQNSAVVVPKSETRTKWTQGGTPIDVSEFNAQITRAVINLRDKPKDAQARKILAEAYLKRAVVLTDARQYAAALGDYRRVLKYDADNEDAKTWVNRIIEIYDGMNKDSPKEGEEPPPLPFKKGV